MARKKQKKHCNSNSGFGKRELEDSLTHTRASLSLARCFRHMRGVLLSNMCMRTCIFERSLLGRSLQKHHYWGGPMLTRTHTEETHKPTWACVFMLCFHVGVKTAPHEPYSTLLVHFFDHRAARCPATVAWVRNKSVLNASLHLLLALFREAAGFSWRLPPQNPSVGSPPGPSSARFT